MNCNLGKVIISNGLNQCRYRANNEKALKPETAVEARDSLMPLF